MRCLFQFSNFTFFSLFVTYSIATLQQIYSSSFKFALGSVDSVWDKVLPVWNSSLRRDIQINLSWPINEISLCQSPHKGGYLRTRPGPKTRSAFAFYFSENMPLFCIGRSWFQLLSDNFLRAHGLEPQREEAHRPEERKRDRCSIYAKCIRMQLKLVRVWCCLLHIRVQGIEVGKASERMSLKREMDARPAEFQVRVCARCDQKPDFSLHLFLHTG